MGGNQGDQGDQGDQGSLGFVGNNRGGLTFPDRVDLPFSVIRDNPDQRVARNEFGEQNWDPGWKAWRAVAQFTQFPWRLDADLQVPNLDDYLTQAGRTVEEEILELFDLARDERPDATGEFVRQIDEFISYYICLCGGRVSTHPKTYLVYAIATLCSSVVTMFWKGYHNRPRPAQLAPGLFTPITFPGHA